jgi:hypothetical protein
MGLTHAEFLRGLPAAIGGKPYIFQQNEVVIAETHRRVAIHLEPESRYTLGLLQLPMTCITFTFARA